MSLEGNPRDPAGRVKLYRAFGAALEAWAGTVVALLIRREQQRLVVEMTADELCLLDEETDA